MAEEKKKHPNPLIILMKSKKVIVIIIIVIILIIMFGPLVKSKLQPTRYISSSELEKIVSTSDLNVARITYNGIADVKNEKGKIKYYVYYESTVTAAVDMTQIKFEVDNEDKVIKPILPEIEFNKPIIKEKSFDFIPNDVEFDYKAVLKACKTDVKNEVKSNKEIYELAEDNLKKTIEGLLLPVTDAEGYIVEWNNNGGGKDEK